MGCDGGTIPKRNELVKTKKTPEKKDKEAELACRWRYCAINHELLEKPISSCGLGLLYSKTSVIEGLLDRSLFPDSISHIKSLKDVQTLNLTENPSYNNEMVRNDDSLATKPAPFICPVMGLEMNGKYRFLFLWKCGCVFSERAFKEIAAKTKLCVKCQTSFEEDDIVIINAENGDLELMQSRMSKRTISNKKAKKKRRAETSIEVDNHKIPTVAL